MSGRPRFLVVRLSSLGDVALATSVVGSLRESLPACHITFLTQPRYTAMLQAHPGLDEVLACPAAPMPAWEWVRYGAGLRSRRFDALVDLQYNWRTLGLSLGLAPLRTSRWNRAHFARRALVRRGGAARGGQREPVAHVVERFHAAVHPWARGPAQAPHVVGGPPAWQSALDLLGGLAPATARWMAVVPVARWNTKRWPPDRFAALCRRWTEEEGRHALAFFGPGDRAVRAEFEAALAEVSVDGIASRSNPAGGTAPGAGPAGGAATDSSRVHAVGAPLDVTAELLRRMEVVVSGDTGLAQLAVAVGTPVAALFGATSPAFGFAHYGPRHRVLNLAPGCQPCSLHGGDACPLGHHRCLEELDVERVWRELCAITG
ncbi:MAG: glycosyltransferase family 9 protein [Candidatus Eisenbacteria bacterium]|nr:glycosyltransferase family 9 protein [Candidatus Eisenbacteria bacterium]